MVVVGYPHLFIGAVPGSLGRCLKGGWIHDSDQDWLNSVADQIDTALQTAAFNAGFGYLSTTTAFAGHELCSSVPWFRGILDPTPNDTPAGLEKYVTLVASAIDKQRWFHPNALGYAQQAKMLASAVQVP